jgi:hypothetical protein
MRNYGTQETETAIPVHYGNETVLVPEVVDGRNLRQLFNLTPNQFPARVTREGDYVPIKDHDEYRINQGDTFTRVNRLING